MSSEHSLNVFSQILVLWCGFAKEKGRQITIFMSYSYKRWEFLGNFLLSFDLSFFCRFWFFSRFYTFSEKGVSSRDFFGFFSEFSTFFVFIYLFSTYFNFKWTLATSLCLLSSYEFFLLFFLPFSSHVGSHISTNYKKFLTLKHRFSPYLKIAISLSTYSSSNQFSPTCSTQFYNIHYRDLMKSGFKKQSIVATSLASRNKPSDCTSSLTHVFVINESFDRKKHTLCLE